MTGDETALRELLQRATPELGSLVPPADQARVPPRHRTFLAVGAAVAGVAAVAVVVALAVQLTTSHHHPSGPAGGPSVSFPVSFPVSVPVTNSVPPSGLDPLTVQIQLDETTVPAGQPINGVAVVTNSTDHELTITDCNGGWLQVGLTTAGLPYSPAWAACLSVPGTILQPGTTRIPITVQTRYNQCTGRPDEATDSLPACLASQGGQRDVMPPLPPGTYRTAVAILEPKGVHVPTPDSIEVTLT